MSLLQSVKGFLFPEPFTPQSPPAWVGRLKPSKYLAPDGTEIEFDYLDLSSAFVKKTSVFESVDGDGAYVQDNGLAGNRFPVMMLLHGADNDLDGIRAVQALTQRGEGTLYHPTWGPIKVIPAGDISVTNNYVTGANETQITCEFFETTGILIDDKQAFDAVLDSFNAGADTKLADTLDLDDAADEVTFKSKVERATGKIKQAVDSLSGGIATLQDSTDDTFDSINNGIDLIVGSPLLLAAQTRRLILSPAQQAGLVRSKLDAYANMARSFFVTPKPNGYDKTAANDFAFNAFLGSTAIAAAATSTVGATLKTKKDYIDLATNLDDLQKDFIDFLNDGNTALDAPDLGGGWFDLLELVSQQIGNLIAQARDATTEVTITTETERPAIDWCFELFGSTHNDTLWDFARLNDLGGDELLMIQPGRELRYYV